MLLFNKNVTMSCLVEEGNPMILDSVLWFYEDSLLSELAGCSDG